MMPWRFSTSTGQMLDPAGTPMFYGYSGHGDGVNNPDMESVHDVGPIPRGMWIIGPAVDHPVMGRCAMPLTPAEGTETFGRSGFYLHGDLPGGGHAASHGCVIEDYPTRLAISESADNMLSVV